VINDLVQKRRQACRAARPVPWWLGWDALAVGAVLGIFAGGLAGLVLLAARRVTRRSAIAFGPAMLAGAFAAILWGEQIADWYTGGG
jgi:leader peptidase (prepilin peptidase) / N-methyltransferase